VTYTGLEGFLCCNYSDSDGDNGGDNGGDITVTVMVIMVVIFNPSMTLGFKFQLLPKTERF
jgi:hypothetical protein